MIDQKSPTLGASPQKTGEDSDGHPYSDCFARYCQHLVNSQCQIYTTARPPIIVIDGRCMGFEI
jgi:hypothetical protein